MSKKWVLKKGQEELARALSDVPGRGKNKSQGPENMLDVFKERDQSG